jgi:hypothetical protein
MRIFAIDEYYGKVCLARTLATTCLIQEISTRKYRGERTANESYHEPIEALTEELQVLDTCTSKC